MATAPVWMGYDDASERELYVLELDGPDAWPATIRVPSRHVLCLVAGAMHRLSDGEIHGLVRRLLDAGAVYVVAWGSAAERTHALVRDAVLMSERSQAEDTVVMTAAYDGSLDEALAFLLAEATSSAAYADSCRAVLVVTVDAPAEAAAVRRVLAAPAEFLARMAPVLG